MKNVSANVGDIPPESIQFQLGTYVGEDDILRLVEFV
jgi:mannose-6-phosphate isomerase